MFNVHYNRNARNDKEGNTVLRVIRNNFKAYHNIIIIVKQ